jgi:hypothetical protein
VLAKKQKSVVMAGEWLAEYRPEQQRVTNPRSAVEGIIACLGNTVSANLHALHRLCYIEDCLWSPASRPLRHCSLASVSKQASLAALISSGASTRGVGFGQRVDPRGLVWQPVGHVSSFAKQPLSAA